MREKFRQFMVGRYGTDGLNQALSIASIVMLLISLLTRISLFTWLGLVLLILCYYRSLSRNISKRTEENYRYYTLKDRVDGKFRGLKDQWANRKLDLYYQFSHRFDKIIDEDWLEQERSRTEGTIMQYLSKGKKSYIARCQRCGRMLPVGYPFKICEPCFHHSSIID